jgi:hypothetical protein
MLTGGPIRRRRIRRRIRRHIRATARLTGAASFVAGTRIVAANDGTYMVVSPGTSAQGLRPQCAGGCVSKLPFANHQVHQRASIGRLLFLVVHFECEVIDSLNYLNTRTCTHIRAHTRTAHWFPNTVGGHEVWEWPDGFE